MFDGGHGVDVLRSKIDRDSGFGADPDSGPRRALISMTK
jgi:hypothetical protein